MDPFCDMITAKRRSDHMLRILMGRDWTANRDAVLRRIADDVKQRKSGCILIVPELISHDMERML